MPSRWLAVLIVLFWLAMTFVGPLACDAVSRFNADVALISCKALSLDGGPMDSVLVRFTARSCFSHRFFSAFDRR